MAVEADKPKRKVILWLKRIWWFMNPLAVPLLCVAALCIGLVIGYVYLGKQPASDVFKMETWKHMVDLVFG